MSIVTGLVGFAAVYLLWEAICILVLRAFGIRVPFIFLTHFHSQRERDLVALMQGRARGNFILVSGFLFFACPLFLGLIAYDRLSPVNGFGSSRYLVGTAVVLVILAVGGFSTGDRTWQKSRL